MQGSQVSIQGVSKSFGDFQALKSVSCEINPGEFFSLLGPSGCGKTTLLRIIAGFEDPDAGGAVLLDGVNVLPLPSNRRHVNTVFQNYALFPHLSVFENVAFSLRLKKLPTVEIKPKVMEYLEMVKLENEAAKLPAQLSGGQKQRVAIARALINEPRVLLLDEPLSALDAKLRQHMLIELDAIHDRVGITFIYVTHDQQEALSVSDRLAVMDRGEILQIGTPMEIYESPANGFVAGFIGEANTLCGRVTGFDGDDYARIAVEGLGEILADIDKPMQIGDRVQLTLRPEKVRVSVEPPHQGLEHVNVFEGVIDEVIYTGFQSKYFVKVGDTLLRSFRQHANYFLNEKPIRWKQKVHVCWDAEDSYVVSVERP